MKVHKSIEEFKINSHFNPLEEDQISFNFKNDLVELLKMLEKVNPCKQIYYTGEKSLVISYDLRINLLNFINTFPLKIKVRIIGLPISICERGYFGDIGEVMEIVKTMKGLTLILNGNGDLDSKSRALSSFIMEKSFNSFNEYLNSLRAPYRRRINKALIHRNDLLIRELSQDDFTYEHYLLYKSVMERTANPLETLTIEYFKGYDAKLYEFLDRNTSRILGFIQLKVIGGQLYFLFCGFNIEDNKEYDLYYNMLLKIIEEGIDLGVRRINFGQTSEESKLKLGCVEKDKYLAIHHHNRAVNYLLKLLLPYFAYKPYKISHNVFKED